MLYLNPYRLNNPLKPLKMDTHTQHDPNNPNNWHGNNKECSQCDIELDWRFDYENICNACYNKEEEEEETQNK